MKNFILAATAACGLAIAAAPATAQMDGSVQMTAAQKAAYDGWSAENRATYDAWPMDAKTYYWTLPDSQKKIWWNNLDNEQRVKIVMMTPADRTAAWTSINTQLGNTTPTTRTLTTETMTMTPTGLSRMTFKSAGQVQAIDTSPAPAELPICTPEQQDNCINRGAR